MTLRHPGLAAYIVDERGALRKHVNIYVDSELVRDRACPAHPDVLWQQNQCGIWRSTGGDMCVSRTTDGGKTWTTLRNGLPQHAAYDIVYRHALDVTAGGASLAFASTTGNAYLTDDCGESWRCIGQNLPPAYALRFA